FGRWSARTRVADASPPQLSKCRASVALGSAAKAIGARAAFPDTNSNVKHDMSRKFELAVLCAMGIATILVGERTAVGQFYINEIYFDPPHSPDNPNEYIELRGTPGASMSNYYLILVENEDNATHTGSTGQIETIFDLGSYSMGSNGFMTLRDKSS